jgi:hypothetical protein
MGVVLLLAAPGGAVPVDPQADDQIAALILPRYALRTNGEVWVFDSDGSAWRRCPDLDLPLPVDQVSDWQPSFLITKHGDHWTLNPHGGKVWQRVASLPWTPVKPGLILPSQPAGNR